MQTHAERMRLLELEQQRQDLSFQSLRSALAELDPETRLHIPERVLRELDAAFTPAREPSAHAVTSLRLRA